MKMIVLFLQKNFDKIADYFNCSTDYLLDRTDIVNMNTEKNLHNKDEEIENLIF